VKDLGIVCLALLRFDFLPALLKYRQKSGRYPRQEDEGDAASLMELKRSYLSSVGVPDAYVSDELVRWAGRRAERKTCN